MSTSKTAWVQLYQARQVRTDVVESRSPGRPPSLIPRRKVGLTLSQGEISELETWQQRLTELMGRKVSTGETVGILARVCSARMTRIAQSDEPVESLIDLVEKLIGEG